MSQSSNPKEKIDRLPVAPSSKPTNTRSRTGCKNCRDKKKKCTEEKPTCARCHERGLNCVYLPLRPRMPSRRPPSMNRGGSSLDATSPSIQDFGEDTEDLQDLSLPGDTSHESSPVSVTPSLAPAIIRGPQDLSYFRDALAPLFAVAGNGNSFVQYIMPLADRSEMVLNAVCMISKAHQARVDPTATPSGYLDLYQHVLAGLRSSIRQDQSGDPELHLATNVLLAFYEMIQGHRDAYKTIHIYLSGAFSILDLETHVRTSTTLFLEKILYFFDILLSLGTFQPPINTNPERLSILRAPPGLFTSPTDIDPILGVGGQLWPILYRLTKAAYRKRHSSASEASSSSEKRGRSGRSVPDTALNLETERIEIANLLQGWTRPVAISVSSPSGTHQFQLLVEHASAYKEAGLIHLYRELYEMPPATPEVQSLAKGVLRSCLCIVAENGPSFGLLWPFFIAAVNLLDQADVAAADGVFVSLEVLRATNNIALAAKICRQVWRRRELGMREYPWHQAAADLLEAVVFV